jgi:8-oxo-dGTP diphosphatase
MTYRNPTPTVDILLAYRDRGIILIERRNEPLGWALPGGFVDEGETVEHAAIREAKEETDLDVTLTGLFGVYSDPRRDPRQHTMSVVFLATCEAGEPSAQDDAVALRLITEMPPPDELVFDHAHILRDYFAFLETGQRPAFGAGHRGLY